MDAEWVAFPLIQRVLIFVDDGGGIPPFASVAAALRASLAETFARFPVLAGRLVHLPATGDVAIDCADDGGGVRFLVADMGDDVDAARLAGDEDHDTAALPRLVPELQAGVLPAEAMAAQVTRLRGGVAMHHAVVDGRSVWPFLQAWAAACRGEGDADLAAARGVLRKYTPNLPVAATEGFLVHPNNLSRRTFTVSAHQINRLKQRVAGVELRRRRGARVGLRRPSQAPGRRGHALLLRRLPRPPRPAAGRRLPRDVHLRLPGAGHRAGPARGGRRRQPRARRGRGGGGGAARAVGLDEPGGVGGPGPARQRVRVTVSHDGQVVLVGGKGGVQASVSLNPAHMDAFKSSFFSYVA